MESLGDELSLDLRPIFVPRTISDFLKEVSTIRDLSEKSTKLEHFVKELEEEMSKIDAFKRELPLCMLLLNDAILFLKEESKKCSARNIQPVLEEFMPLEKIKKDVDKNNEEQEEEEEEEEEESNSSHSRKGDKDITDKMSWMCTFQLWNPDGCSSDSINRRFPDLRIINRVESERNEDSCKNRSFRENSCFLVRNEKKEKEETSYAPGLTLLRMSGGRGISVSGSNNNVNYRSLPQPQGPPPPPPLPPQEQAARKQRRCWSPELHRRFVNALEQLGGSQVATPKQIREIMQVEGLTNDEVKSHLQKYRLHAKKHQSNSNSNLNLEGQSVVLLGSKIWNSSENIGGESSKGSSLQSGSPEGPLQLAAATTMTGGDSMEDEDDAKSDCFTWKGHNCHPQPLKDHL